MNHVMTTGNIGSALVAACLRKQEANVQSLIKRGADVNMQLVCGEYGTALTAVAVQGDFTIVYSFLHAGAKINMPITSGRFGSALAAACHHNGTEMVKFLINQGASISEHLFHGEFKNSLVAAISGKNKENLKVILKSGASPDCPLQSGSFGDVISLAIHLKDEISINTLIEFGAKPGPLAADIIDMRKFCNSLVSDDHTLAHALSPPCGKVFSTHFKCELPELAGDGQNLRLWLSDMTVLVRKEDTIEYTTIAEFLFAAFSFPGTKFLDCLSRAFTSKESFYDESG